MFKYKYSLTPENHLRFQELFYLVSDIGKRDVALFRRNTIINAFALAAYVYLLTDDVKLFILEAVIFAVIMIILICLAKNIIMYNVKRNIKAQIKNGAITFEETVLTFDDASFSEATEEILTKYNYSAIKDIYVTPTDIFIFVSKVQAILLPLSVFSSIDEANNLLGFLSTKVDSSKFKQL